MFEETHYLRCQGLGPWLCDLQQGHVTRLGVLKEKTFFFHSLPSFCFARAAALFFFSSPTPPDFHYYTHLFLCGVRRQPEGNSEEIPYPGACEPRRRQ